ncbi:hypothetical protein HVPorG_04206 [Roseomonas mucosa]|nr:hypothetical protein HVIM_04206 [Roseomonas mucosa]QDD98779.1 hypothetical protein ADP8_04206 [Roseomonas mucosa]QDJ08432.1 hypothetical protein HVPorG_04206 [Roseomonas mucosa]UZO90974.1 Hypothetical protein RMP42_04206 [Roseomonas mucosa]
MPRGGPPGERRRLSRRTPSPPGTEAGPRTPGLSGFRWLPLVFGLIPGEQVETRGSRKEEDPVSALAAPAVRRRARLSGAIRPAAGANSSGPGPAGSWRIRGAGGKGGALSPGTARRPT